MKELNQAAAAVKNTKDSAKQNILGNFFYNSCIIIKKCIYSISRDDFSWFIGMLYILLILFWDNMDSNPIHSAF